LHREGSIHLAAGMARAQALLVISIKAGARVPEPIVVTISHRLGRDAAKRRIDEGLGHIRGALAPFATLIDYGWTDYRLGFRIVAMRQPISGRIDVEDQAVRIEIGLPLLLRILSGRIIGRIRSEGSQLLDKPAV
jgi:hypothetical protein